MCEFPQALKLEDLASELAIGLKIAVRRDWFNPTVKHNSVWNECKLASPPWSTEKKAAAITSPDDDSSDEEEDPNALRALSDDFSPFNPTVQS